MKIKWNPKVGETYTRMLAGAVATQVEVMGLDTNLVYVCPPGAKWPLEECWTFDYEGKEVDPYMTSLMVQYGYPADAVVSYIKLPGVDYAVEVLKPK